jgi:peptidyl-prolyl cis-trans isomerase A (cyclophilin A)
MNFHAFIFDFRLTRSKFPDKRYMSHRLTRFPVNLHCTSMTVSFSRCILACVFLITLLVSGCGTDHPKVKMITKLGAITVEVYEQAAPVTAGNFLRYVDEKRFDGAHFYRVVTMQNQPDNEVKIEVIQGGLGHDDQHPQRLPPIRHETTEETGILHTDGVISMARLEPGTTGAELFICIGDQPELDFGGRRNPDGQGFAAFGKVVGGMEVVRRIQQQPAEKQALLKPVTISSIHRVR